MNRAAILVLMMLALPALADPPADAPVIVKLEAGEPFTAPVAGAFIDEQTLTRNAKAAKGDRARVISLEKSIADAPSPLMLVSGGVVIGVLLGLAAPPLLEKAGVIRR